MPSRECLQCGAALVSEVSSELCPECASAATLADTADPTVDIPASGRPPGEVLRAGDIVGQGRFALVRPLGRGGLGEVWLAEDRQLGRVGEEAWVALKFLKETIRADKHRRDEFRREVLRSRGLAHPNLVWIIDWHEAPGEPVFYSMEYVDGVTWQQLQASQPHRRLTWQQLRPLAMQLGEALHHAHTSRGLVHSDVKPANVLVDRLGQVKLGDFGMARRVAMVDGQGLAEVRRGGTRVYMSPQQFRGEPALLADDLYAFGATLYHLLTGELPVADGPGFAARLEAAVPPPVLELLRQQGMAADLPPAAAAAIGKCLEKQPENRPAGIRELQRRLGAPILPRIMVEGPSPDEPTPLAAGRGSDLRGWLALVATMGVLISAGWVTWDWRQRGESSWIVGIFREGERGPVVTNPPRPVPPDSAPPEPDASRRGNESRTPGHVEISFAGAPRNLGVITWRVLDSSNLTVTNGSLPAGGMITVELPPGNCRIEAGTGIPSAANWVAETITVTPGAELSFKPSWEPGSHKLLVNLVPGTRVEVEDWWTKTPVAAEWFPEPVNGVVEWQSIQGPKLRPGLVTYRVSAPHYRTLEERLQVQSGPAKEVRLHLEPSPFPMPGLAFTNELLELRFQPVGGFWAAERETTVGQFRRFAAEAAGGLADGPLRRTTAEGQRAGGRSWRDAVPNQTEEHPVVGVNWRDAMKFGEWLTTRERADGRLTRLQRYTLPTDDQWSALAGERRYPWGDGFPPAGRENLAGEEARQTEWPRQWPVLRPADHGDPFPRTSPVRSFPVGMRGLFDVGGNVSEWCLDPYRPELNAAEILADNPDLAITPGGETERVIRGGCWADDEEHDLRRETRRRRPETDRNDWTGFRLVLIEEPDLAKDPP